MTPDQLRADADRREALARAATPGRWHDAPLRNRRFGNVAEPEGCTVAEECAHGDRLHIVAHDPPAVLASVERDRLLADMVACAIQASEEFLTQRRREPLPRGFYDLLARFTALSVKK